MDKGNWLELLARTATCWSCGATYGAEGLTLLAGRDDCYFVSSHCPSCQRKAVGVVMVRPMTQAPIHTPFGKAASFADVICADDVIDAHLLLAQHTGDILSLIESPARTQP